MQDWFGASEKVGSLIVESDDRVASTEPITKEASPDLAVTLHDDRRVTAEITLMTEPGMNLRHQQLVTGRASPEGCWWLDVRRHSNDPPSQSDDAPVKKALRQIIAPQAPVAAAHLEGRYGGGSEMRVWQQSYPWEKPPWHDEARACCDEILRRCVAEVPGFEAAHAHHEIRLRLMLTIRTDLAGVVISPLHHGYGGQQGDLSDLRDHAQRRIDEKSARQQSRHPGEKWLVLMCAHLWLVECMQDAFVADDTPMHDHTLAPLTELDLRQFDEVWIAAPLNSEGDEARTVKLTHRRPPSVSSCAL